jgi:hypothetical protein
MVKTPATFILFCAVGLYAHELFAAESAAAADPWQSLQFLLGTWEAKTEGGSANATGSGTYIFQRELGKHILARYSGSKGCKGPADFNCEHGDLLFVYQDSQRQPLKAIYFDNEGHVIHYDVTVPAPGSAIFLSDGSREGPQFRLTYVLAGAVMSGKFQVRMPGQTDFKSYLEWSGTKK